MEGFVNMNSDVIKICVVSFPWASRAPYKFLSDLLKILEPLSKSIVLLGGSTDRIDVNCEKVKIKDIGIKMYYVKDVTPKFYSIMLWGIKCTVVQIKTSLELFRLSKDVDVVIFYAAYPYYLLPLLSANVLGKKTLEIITYTSHTQLNSGSILGKIFRLQDKLLLSLIDYISPLSQSIISQSNRDRYKDKILPIGARFIDIDSFRVKRNIDERKNIVGYIGRLVEGKGLMNFVKAVPLIMREHEDVEFLIGGDGDLFDEIKRIIDDKGYKITLPGWIPEEKIPDYLNELKLLVLPTDAEGLPTIILEAMACGTPVLATSVGGIPDVITDGETGFILEDNSPECIAQNVIRALNGSILCKIVNNARKLIEEEFTYEAAVERYREILERIKEQK